MSYVDAGYAVALGALFLYAVSLAVRRRRWERAYEAAVPGDVVESPAGETGEPS